MTLPILAFLALFAVQSYIPATIRYLRSDKTPVESALHALGARDEMPPLTVHGERAQRAMANLLESTPAFLALTLLHETQPELDPTAVLLAWGFLAARALYVPCYVFGVRGLRSAMWSLAGAALLGMVARLFT